MNILLAKYLLINSEQSKEQISEVIIYFLMKYSLLIQKSVYVSMFSTLIPLEIFLLTACRLMDVISYRDWGLEKLFCIGIAQYFHLDRF